MRRHTLPAAAVALAHLPAALPQIRPGCVVDLDFVANEQDGREPVRVAAYAGAGVINVVPPGHVWDCPDAVRMLDGTLNEIARRDLKFVICRIGAAQPPDADRNRRSYLFGRILTLRGVMPDAPVT